MITGYKIDYKSLKKRRICKGVTQTQIADKLGVSKTAICNIENGKCTPMPDLLKRVCDELDVNMEEIVDVE